MIVTDDDRIARLCQSMSNQGWGEPGVWLSHERLGYNYRMDEISAALGVAQMSRIEEIVTKCSGGVMRRGAQQHGASPGEGAERALALSGARRHGAYGGVGERAGDEPALCGCGARCQR